MLFTIKQEKLPKTVQILVDTIHEDRSLRLNAGIEITVLWNIPGTTTEMGKKFFVSEEEFNKGGKTE